jgi:hypothetical protein
MGVKSHLEKIEPGDIPELLRPKVKNLIVGLGELLK